MRRPWIKVETTTPDKPEVCAIATALRLDPDAVLGKLIRLWSWVEVNRVPSNDLGVTKEFIDKLVGRKGFAAALIAAGWLVEAEGKLGLKNLERHNGNLAKVRALTAQRVALHRKRKLARAAEEADEALHSGHEVSSDSDDAESVQTEPEPLESSETDGDQLQPHPVANVTHPHPSQTGGGQHDSAAAGADSAPPTELEAEGATEENAPRKRRHRDPFDSPDQPMLF